MKLKILISLSGLLLLSTIARSQFTKKVYLSGTGADHTVNWDFYCSGGMNSGRWSTIPVPSNWELQGFGKYDYGFAKDSVRGKEYGLYKHTFKADPDWKNKIVNIVFEGAMTDTEVKINGILAGEIHQGAFYVFKYDVSKLLKFGESNLLEVKVAKHSANQSVNEAERKADFWIFGGIFRPVFLEISPVQEIQRVSIDAKANGQFKAVLKAKGLINKIRVQLHNLDGKPYGKALDFPVKANAKNQYTVEHQFLNPKLWSTEFPNLYEATFTLYNGNRSVNAISKRIGFRTIEVRQRDGVYINGAKIKFKGVNRHSFYPTSGRTTSKKISVADVMLIKEMNMNAVRMSHYPPDGHFLDVCDSLGLFVMDELAGWHGNYDTPTGTKLLKEMFQNDENHPSIVFWANGNEGGHNRQLDPLFLEQDLQKRPVIHPWEIFGGFETTHYREYNYGIGNYDHGHQIIMPTEFLHGMFDGGHGAGLEDYWNAMWSNPLSAGGFLWDFADQGVVRTDRNGEIDTDGNRGPDGIVGPYHQKEGSFYTIKEVWSPIFFEKREMTADFNGRFNIENRYSFTNLNQCTFTYQLKRLKNALHSEIRESTALSPNIKPNEKGILQLILPPGWQTFDALYITAKDPHGREIFTWSFPIVMPVEVSKKMLKTSLSAKISVQDGDADLHVNARGINLVFDKRTGLLKSVKNKRGDIPFTNGPILQEGINNFKNITHVMKDDTLVISSTFDRKESFNVLQWKIFPSGMVKLEVQYFPSAYFSTFVGINFSYPETEINAVEYMGSGPYRVWKNRMKGNRFGIWRKTYNTSATGEAPFEYPEFKGYHANMYWCRFIGKTNNFKVFTDQEDLFLRLFTPKKSKDTEYDNMSPTFPSGDISFMNGISAIGTKTQKPETTGPMGMKHIFYDFEKEPSRALHIVLYFDFSGDE